MENLEGRRGKGGGMVENETRVKLSKKGENRWVTKEI